jgi:hypothetical protein
LAFGSPREKLIRVLLSFVVDLLGSNPASKAISPAELKWKTVKSSRNRRRKAVGPVQAGISLPERLNLTELKRR